MTEPEVLVVDSDPTIRLLIARHLEQEGFKVHLASSQAEAKEPLEQQPIAAVVSALELPDGSGQEMLELVRAIDRNLRTTRCACMDYPDSCTLSRTLHMPPGSTQDMQEHSVKYGVFIVYEKGPFASQRRPFPNMCRRSNSRP